MRRAREGLRVRRVVTDGRATTRSAAAIEQQHERYTHSSCSKQAGGWLVSSGMLQVPSTVGRRCDGWRTFAAPRCRRLSVTPSGAKARLTALQGLELLDRVKTFVFDCDGVIWRGEAVISGVPETLDLLRSHGKRLIFLTNNSTKSRKGYCAKFESLGIGSVYLCLTT